MNVCQKVAAITVAAVLGSMLSTLAAEENLPDFETDVMPVLTKAGCNSAACHGAAIGRGGFRLSLFGHDPQLDYQRIVYQYKSRRVNLSQPEKSLVLLKPSRQIAHKGGRRLPSDSEGFDIFRRWVAAGAPRESTRSLVNLQIEPNSKLLSDVGEEYQLKVTAQFSDGRTSDVTRWAVYTANDEAAVQVNRQGKIKTRRRGQSSVMIRYLDRVGCATVTVRLADRSQPVPENVSELAGNNFVDDFVNQRLVELNLDISESTTDHAFVRRIYLDLIGALPTPAEVRDFVNDNRANKRNWLIEELMERTEFVDYWSYHWGDILRIESRRLSRNGAEAFHRWVRRQLSDNTPLDEMARQLIMAEGDSFEVGAANFHRVARNPIEQAEYMSNVFLGVRLQCANCHNHPLDRWTQDDFHGLAAVFAGLSRDQTVKQLSNASVIHPRTQKKAVPKLPGERFIDASDLPREQLADWLTGAENPFFARVTANRIWQKLMGRGLVEPVDDHRATNPATHPQLLDALARELVDHGFDLRHLIKTIVLSRAYQRSSRAVGNNLTDDRFYSKAIVRPLSPVVMVDAVSHVTGIAEKFGATPMGTKAIELGDAQVNSVPLDLLGRCSRVVNCEAPESVGEPSLSLSLHVINGEWLNEKIAHPDGRLLKLVKRASDIEFITRMYELCYSRKPDERELRHWREKLHAEDEKTKTVMFQDFMWALLNSTEFCTNH